MAKSPKYLPTGKALRDAMQVRELTPTNLTAKLGIAKGSTRVYSWLRGDVFPPPPYDTKLRELLGIDLPHPSTVRRAARTSPRRNGELAISYEGGKLRIMFDVTLPIDKGAQLLRALSAAGVV